MEISKLTSSIRFALKTKVENVDVDTRYLAIVLRQPEALSLLEYL